MVRWRWKNWVASRQLIPTKFHVQIFYSNVFQGKEITERIEQLTVRKAIKFEKFANDEEDKENIIS